jgi:ABC-type sugar transport system ATPase subunit
VLTGENGAGKSTLMKIIAGLLPPTSGQVRVRGCVRAFRSPRDALECGIAMIHQELNLVPRMTVAENIWLGREPHNRWGWINHHELCVRTRTLLEQVGLDLVPERQVATLPVGKQQLVEIARALSYDSDVLIMDEPTSSLTEHEAVHLFRIIKRLRDGGRAVVYITHKMDEVFKLADEISVFRDGRHITTDFAAAFDQQKLVTLMVGRELTQLFPKVPTRIGAAVVSVQHLSVAGTLQDISFDVHRGEILGIAGLLGAGRTAVAETLFGLLRPTDGRILVDGEAVRIDTPARAMAYGFAYVTEDRKSTGLFPARSVLENMQIASLNEHCFRGVVRQSALRTRCEEMASRLRIKVPALDDLVATLSGGNQQKILIARWLMTGPRLLILDEPTRGIDVGAKAEIHQLISQLAEQGMAVILISSELSEILGMSDRVLVMREGGVRGVMDRGQASQESIMALAAQ